MADWYGFIGSAKQIERPKRGLYECASGEKSFYAGFA